MMLEAGGGEERGASQRWNGQMGQWKGIDLDVIVLLDGREW